MALKIQHEKYCKDSKKTKKHEDSECQGRCFEEYLCLGQKTGANPDGGKKSLQIGIRIYLHELYDLYQMYNYFRFVKDCNLWN